MKREGGRGEIERERGGKEIREGVGGMISETESTDEHCRVLE